MQSRDETYLKAQTLKQGFSKRIAVAVNADAAYTLWNDAVERTLDLMAVRSGGTALLRGRVSRPKHPIPG